MSAPVFARLQPGYTRLWAALAPLPQHAAEIKTIGEGILAHKAAYMAVETATGIPWWWVAITDQMEGGGGAHTHLHNGDSLAHYTVNDPAGRPQVGHGPPFAFLESAIDAIRFDGVTDITTVERAAYGWEAFNGWGYLHLPIEDPYLAGWSNKDSPGKYIADHQFDPTARTKQPGALTILKVLLTLDPTITLAQGSPPVTTPAPVALPPLDLMKLELQLETIAPIINMVAAFIPGAAPFTALIPVAEQLLKLAAALQAAPDLPSKLAVLESHLHDIASLLGQAKAVLVPAAAKA